MSNSFRQSNLMVHLAEIILCVFFPQMAQSDNNELIS